jgi:hypothetical protein
VWSCERKLISQHRDRKSEEGWSFYICYFAGRHMMAGLRVAKRLSDALSEDLGRIFPPQTCFLCPDLW